MVKNHLKRLVAPKTWGIKKKENTWVTRPFPGAHKIEMGIPINVLIKDLLKIAKTSKEVTRLLHHKEIFIDAKPRKDAHFIAGLFDAIWLPKIEKFYRIILDSKKKLNITEIDEKESNLKLTKITGKSLVKGKTQLNCSDSRTICVEKDGYKTGDSLLIDLPGQNIKEYLKFEKGSSILLTGGKHMGDHGKLDRIEGNDIFYKSSKGKTFQTLKKYAFVTGKEKPAIKLAYHKNQEG